VTDDIPPAWGLIARTGASRAIAWLWRLNGLRVAETALGHVPTGTIRQRRLFGGSIPLDLPRTSVHRQLFLSGERFVEERFLLQQLLKPGDVVCDVGANIGYYLLLIEQAIGARGAVLCIEPEPDNLLDLRRVIAANEFENVKVLPVACGDRGGTVRLARGINSGVTPEGELTVPMVTLDDVASPHTTFLKIDVEGFEGHVLAGGQRLLEQARPRIFVEVHPGMLAPPYSVEEIVDSIREKYEDVSLYEPKRHSKGRQIAAHYLGADIVKQIPNSKALLQSCRTGERRIPFWLVARGRTQNRLSR
jgi:FkbM family methyltransferase